MALNDTYDIGNLPILDLPRSKFTKNHQHLTTFNVGELVPIFCDELLPGCTINIRTNKLIRLQTLLNPIFSNIYMDTYYFFIPYRLVWSHFVNFMGENTASEWYPSVTYSIPQLVANSTNGFPSKSVADHFGIPTKCKSLSVNALPFRAYALVWNEFFRDENLSSPIAIPTGDSTVNANYQSSSFNYINDGYKGLDLLKVAKYRDVFTTCLPAPQKGPAVGVGLSGLIDVKTGDVRSTNIGTADVAMYTADTVSASHPVVNLQYGRTGSNIGFMVGETEQSQTTLDPDVNGFRFTNLYGDLGSATASIPINELRLAVATQKLLERDARYGTRYIEIIQGHFGITSPDARLQRPEFIGGNHFTLNIDQVVETSGTTDSYVLGETGAYSVTADSSDDVVAYSSTEHGIVIGLACCRYEHSYQQGLDKMWSRSDRLSFYWPELSNIGEVGVKVKEIWTDNVSTSSTTRENIFGYQEAWYDYRTKKSYCTGEMRSNYNTPLDSWHLADYYNSKPVLGNDWILEDGNVVNRVLAVSNNVSDQVFADFYFEYDYIAPIPVYSIPSLIDMR